MNKSELIAAVAAETGETKRATEDTINALAKVLKQAAANGERVAISGLFMMSTSKKAERIGRNPRTGVVATIPARTVVKFKAAKEINDHANGK